jgi:glucuronoarabinoxylan endo-1,4-beta-xylanase
MNKKRLILSGLFSMALMFMLLFVGCPDAPPDEGGEDLAGTYTVTVDTATKYQYVRGFGGMSNAWNTGAGQDINVNDMEEMFNPAKLGYNMFRIMIYPYPIENILNNVEFPNHDNSDYYDLVKKVNDYGGYVLASPWTPPAEMKEKGTLNGSDRLLPAQYGAYADYLKSYLQNMNTNGAPVYAISIQNEPNWAASYDGCDWTPNEMRDWFKQNGHFTDGIAGYGGGAATNYVLTMNGESANHPNINDAALNDPVSAAAIDVIGRHIYGNAQVRYAKALNMEKEVWMTEHNVNGGNETSYPNDSTWDYVWKFMNEVDLSMRLNDESAFIWWYAKRFYSMIGDGDYGTVEGDVLPRGHALSHYAKFAKESWRVNVETDIPGANPRQYKQDSTDVKVTAYESKDGSSISLVLFTPTNAKGQNGIGIERVEINLPEDFTATSATAMVSNKNEKRVNGTVTLSADGKKGTISLPISTIVSVKFSK